jgi:hypothetical protein
LPASYLLDDSKKQFFGRYENKNHLVELLTYYISNQDVLKKLSQNYHDFVTDNYSSQKIRADFVNFINIIQ